MPLVGHLALANQVAVPPRRQFGVDTAEHVDDKGSMKILDVPQSGSLAGQTSSRNRFGQYRRTRANPVNPATTFQTTARARLSTNAAAWRLLTAEQRAAWDVLGSNMTRTDSLGQTYRLTGAQAYASVNGNRLAAGDAVVATAPGLTTPDIVTLGAIVCTNAAHTIAYTVTPLPAGERLFIFTSKQRSAGRAYEGDLRLVMVTAAAAASTADIKAAYLARFGALVIGQRIFYSVARYATGFTGVPSAATAVVSA